MDLTVQVTDGPIDEASADGETRRGCACELAEAENADRGWWVGLLFV